MKNLGEIKESKDITTKEYVDGKMVIIDNTDIIEKINSGFNGRDSYVFDVSQLLTEDEKNKLKNADAVQLALEELGGNSYYRIALHKTESEEYFQGTGIVTSTINEVNTMSFVRFVSYSLMEIKPVSIGWANTNPNILGNFSYVNKNYVNNQISTAGDGKFLPLVDGGRITNSEHPSLTGTLITSTGIAVDGDNEPHARYGTGAYFYQKSEATDAMTEIDYNGVYISKGANNNSGLTGLHLNLLEFKSGNGVVSGLATPTANTQAANKAYVDALGTRISTNEDNIAMAESDIESLQTDVTTLKTDNTANQAAIKTLQDTYVPNTRKINNKSLDNDIALTASDVGAISQTSADDRYLKLTGGTIADNNDALNIAPYALEFSSTGVELSSSGTLNLSAVGQKEGVVSGLANPTQDDHAANKAYVDSLSFSLLTTVVNSANINSSAFISIVDLDSDNIDFVDSNSSIIYFQYQNQGLKETLNQNVESILANYEIYLDIPAPTTERYPLYKLPEPLPSLQEGNSTTTIYYSSGVIELELEEQTVTTFIVLAGKIMKSSEGAPSNRLIFINLSVSP